MWLGIGTPKKTKLLAFQAFKVHAQVTPKSWVCSHRHFFGFQAARRAAVGVFPLGFGISSLSALEFHFTAMVTPGGLKMPFTSNERGTLPVGDPLGTTMLIWSTPVMK